MNFVLKFLSLYTPDFLKKRELQKLYDIAAYGFSCDTPYVNGKSFNDCLEDFALFTREQSLKALEEKQDISAIRRRMYKGAYQYGVKIRHVFHITSYKEILKVCKFLYKNIFSEFSGNENGGISIKECFFSEYYTPEICRITSALDAGILAGMQGGGYLVFSARITEGHNSCKACLLEKEKQLPLPN